MGRRYRCILLFGAPGVGKGTQGRRLGGCEGYVHLATGDMFRGLDAESPLGRKFREHSSRGELVPDELTVELWQSHVQGLVESSVYDPDREILLLDGIPRSLRQAQMMDGLIDPLAVIHLTAPDLNEMVERMKRRADKEGRLDDVDEEVIRRRFEVYESETAPVLGHYDRAIVHDIDALGTIEQVGGRVTAAVEPIRDAVMPETSGPT